MRVVQETLSGRRLLAGGDARREELFLLGVSMRDPLEEIEETFMTAVELLSLDKRPLDVILPEYARLEADTVERLRQVGGDSLIVALQRRLAAARLSAAKQKHARIDVAAELFKQSSELGY